MRPSKQFIIRGSLTVGIVAVILVVQTTWFKNLFHKKANAPAPVTVGDIITQDSNQNGIADWEEKLWGLDPTVLYTKGVSNKQIIENKKKALGVPDSASEPANETDRLARELFSLTAALGQSEAVDDATLKQIAAKIGASVNVNTTITQYTTRDLTIVPTTVQSLQKYQQTMTSLLARQKPVGDIDVFATALQTEDPATVASLAASVASYASLAKDLRAVPVPIGVAKYHLDIINSFAGITTSFEYMQELADNSVVALVGVATYKTYSARLDTAVVGMRAYLSRYGIL